MTALKQIEAQSSLVEIATEQIRGLISSGTVGPGGKLPTEGELSETLGVSRTVIREALSQLKADDMVRSYRGRGLFVTDGVCAPSVIRFRRIDADRTAIFMDLLEMREGLEMQSARLAAARRNETDIDHLRQTLKRMKSAQDNGEDGVEEDFEFHRAIGQISRNAHIAQVLDFLAGVLKPAIAEGRAGAVGRFQGLLAAYEEHRLIFEAVRVGSQNEAADAMRLHLAAGRARLPAWSQDEKTR